MAEKVHFLPVDLRIHRSQVIDLNVEHLMSQEPWVLREIGEYYEADMREISIREYIANTIDIMCSDTSRGGIYYLVELEDDIIGMGLLRQVREDIGEIKRMYIRPAHRGKGYGKALLHQLLRKAKEFGYHSVYLDTGPYHTAAHHLYHSVGFIERDEYPETEIPPPLRSKWVFMEKTLKDTTKRIYYFLSEMEKRTTSASAFLYQSLRAGLSSLFIGDICVKREYGRYPHCKLKKK